MTLKGFENKQSPNKSSLKMPSKILRKKVILLGMLGKRQRFNEIRTIKGVENSSRLVFEEIEKYFEQKKRSINSLLPELISGNKSWSTIFDHHDLATIYRITENIIRNELLERFKCPVAVVGQIKKTNHVDWISNIFRPIDKYLKTKKRTVLISSNIEALCRRNLSDSIELLMGNSLITKLLCNIDISTIILPKLGINPSLEIMELNEELMNRIGGAFYINKGGLGSRAE